MRKPLKITTSFNWWYGDFEHQFNACRIKFNKKSRPLGFDILSLPFLETFLNGQTEHLVDCASMFSEKKVANEQMLTGFLVTLKKLFQTFYEKKTVFIFCESGEHAKFCNEKVVGTWNKVARALAVTNHVDSDQVVKLNLVNPHLTRNQPLSAAHAHLHLGAARESENTVSCKSFSEADVLGSRFMRKVNAQNILQYIEPTVWNGTHFTFTDIQRILTNNKLKTTLDVKTAETFARYVRQKIEKEYTIVVTNGKQNRRVCLEAFAVAGYQTSEIFSCDGTKKMSEKTKIILYDTSDIFPLQSFKIFKSVKKKGLYVIADSKSIASIAEWIKRPLSLILSCASKSVNDIVVHFVM